MKNNDKCEYKMRADCQSDADHIRAHLAPWLARWQVSDLHLEHNGKPFWIPDVVIQFTITAEGPTKGQLKWLINSLSDCHVAAESLDAAAKYTGKRHYLEKCDYLSLTPTPEMLEKSLENLTHYRDYLDFQMERLADAQNSLEAAVAITRLSACAKRPRRAAVKR